MLHRGSFICLRFILEHVLRGRCLLRQHHIFGIEAVATDMGLVSIILDIVDHIDFAVLKLCPACVAAIGIGVSVIVYWYCSYTLFVSA